MVDREEYLKKYREKNRNKINKNKREKYSKTHYKKYGNKIKKASEKYRKNNPKKIKAQNLARQIKIPKETLCCICEERLATDKHHEDYNNPLEIYFCCGICHSELDKQRQAREETV